MGNDGNIMPLCIYTNLFPNITNEQVVSTKTIINNRKTTITQLGKSTVELGHKNNMKIVIFCSS